MRKLLLASVAALAMTVAGPALAADMPLKAPPPFAVRFTWTGCYLGAHLGGGFAHKDVTDPVELVQDSFLGVGSTAGVTTTSLSPSGAVIGGQIGCDYQFAPSWVVGIEGSASGSTLDGSTTVGLPQSRYRDSESKDRFPDQRDRTGRICVRRCAAIRQGRWGNGGGPIRRDRLFRRRPVRF
jgi:opacity protein-like surface antigen